MRDHAAVVPGGEVVRAIGVPTKWSHSFEPANLSGVREVTRTAAALGLTLGFAGFAGLAGAAPVAGAATRIGRTEIVLSGRGARVTIHRSPYRLSVAGGRGAAVLRELRAGARSAPVPAATRNLSGLGGQPLDPPRAALYGPLTFLVGRRALSLIPGSQFGGNLSSLFESGTEYRARAVRTVRRVPGGVRLVLSTTDPSGRTLVVRVRVAGRGASVSARPVPASGVAAIADSFASRRGEAFHGFGGRHDRLDQHGRELLNWAQQENIASGRAEKNVAAVPGTARDTLYPNGSAAAYYAGTSLVSSAGYGFLLRENSLSEFRLDSDRAGAWQAGASGARLSYLVAPGGPARALRTLTATTGRQPVPPAWALGPMFDREVKFPVDTPQQYAREVTGDLRDLRRYHLPVSSYRIEGWQFLRKPFLRGVIKQLHARGIHALLYFREFVGKDTIGTDDPRAYARALARGYVARRANGRPFVFTTNFGKDGAVIDFTNPAAVRWWQGRIRAALALGADGFMQDFGEQVQVGMRLHNGASGATMHNRLPVLAARATRDVVRWWERAHRGRRIFFFTRAGNTGAPGSAAYEGGNFPGDETTDWSHASGIASLATDMLSRGVSGAYGFGTDIGGYYDIGPYENPTNRELFLRWAEWAALSPVFRLHGALLAGVHTPWMYGPETLRTYIALSRLHTRAAPLILKLWKAADRTGIPVARPLWLGAGGDRRLAREDQEWLLGPDVLVAPVVVKGARTRRVVFPRGCWRDAHTGRRFAGPAVATVPAPLTRLVYFARCGRRPF